MLKPGLLFRSAASRAPDAPLPAKPVGIIDIGSNSIRLVVYEGPSRIPSILFNEKVMVGLGKGLAATGALDPDAVDRAFHALDRFRLVAERMEVGTLHTVATAAVREASNGEEFRARAAALGLSMTVLSGAEEAEMAGEGVIAAFPNADGIVGDLGGGSLELVRVRDGKVHERSSFPLGVLRIVAIRKRGPRALARTVAEAFGQAGWRGAGKTLPFYMVGGSWRALARLAMHRSGYPLPIVHGFTMEASTIHQVARAVSEMDRAAMKAVPGLSTSRAATLADAAALLAAVTDELKCARLVTSAYGLREGVLHHTMPEPVRAADPLICATREEGRRQGRFAEHGDLLETWVAPLFVDDAPEEARLRHAACLLADVGWRAHPEFRAERGVETALHGAWVGIDARGRAMMAQALFTSFGASGEAPVVGRLCAATDLLRAQQWGLAMRLGQRLSGGVAGPLRTSRVARADEWLDLVLDPADAALYGEAVERRHRTLAECMGLRARHILS